MQTAKEDGVLTLFLAGDIDAQNAADVQREILAILEAEEFAKLVLDAGGLEYISSVGLRVILATQKKAGGKITVVKASPFVAGIFKMAGLQHFMDIEGA